MMVGSGYNSPMVEKKLIDISKSWKFSLRLVFYLSLITGSYLIGSYYGELKTVELHKNQIAGIKSEYDKQVAELNKKVELADEFGLKWLNELTAERAKQPKVEYRTVTKEIKVPYPVPIKVGSSSFTCTRIGDITNCY